MTEETQEKQDTVDNISTTDGSYIIPNEELPDTLSDDCSHKDEQKCVADIEEFELEEEEEPVMSIVAREVLLELGEEEFGLEALLKADIQLHKLIFKHVDDKKKRRAIYDKYAQFCGQWCVEYFDGYWVNQRNGSKPHVMFYNGTSSFRPYRWPSCSAGIEHVPDLLATMDSIGNRPGNRPLDIKKVAILYNRKFSEIGLCDDGIDIRLKKRVMLRDGLNAFCIRISDLSI